MIDQWDWSGCDAVQYNPEKMSGAATVGPVRFTAEMVLELTHNGTSLDDLLANYALDRAPVERILAYAEERGFQPAD